MRHLERRDGVYPGAPVFESRQEGDEGAAGLGMLVGVAVPWGSLSEVLWFDHRTGKPVRERFERGAFSEVLADPEHDTMALWDHEGGKLMGRRTSGTLQVRETAQGLEYEASIPDTSHGRDLRALALRKDIRGSSFSFHVPEGGDVWEETDDELIRTVKRCDELYDVAPISTHPAYPASSAGVRQASGAAGVEHREAAKSLERWRGDREALGAARARELELLEL